MPLIFGFSTLGFVHTVVSLLALASGLIVLTGLLAAKRLNGLTALYLASALATTATGLAFPGGFDIPHAIGGASLFVLVVAILARYAFRLAGYWRQVYAIAAVLEVWLLVFFTIGEAFLRAPPLKTMAPTLTELPFALAQITALAIFLVLAFLATRTFRYETVAETQR